jgi:release factor glutamine methyltransferase
VEAAADLDPSDLTNESVNVGPRARAQAETLARRRVGGEPLQYVTGVAGFRRLELAVGPGVLVPRPETEIVAERAMARLPESGVLVDCGTGSGAIALAVADERPDARVFATETSREALRWAERNRDALGLEVELLSCDLLTDLPSDFRRAVDVIVSNPPYVATTERDLFAADVIEHEPHEALFAGDGGLDVIRRLVDEALAWLRPGGWLVLEIGERQGDEVRELLGGCAYGEVGIHPDLAGRNRIAEGRAPR